MAPRSLRRICLSASWLSLSACAASAPQSRAEFLDAVREGRGRTTYETDTASGSLDSVIQVLKERSKACLNQPGTPKTVYRGSVHELGGARAEFTVQVEPSTQSEDAEVPPGGFFLMAVDLVGESRTRTQVYYYLSISGHGGLADAVRAWGRGERAECPELS